MLNSITETLKKINIELKGNAFISIVILLLISNTFLWFKIVEAVNFNNNLKIDYIENQNKSGDYSDLVRASKTNNFIYASKKGKKYYFYNCKSSIKAENKIYFNTEEEAKESGLTLASTCR